MNSLSKRVSTGLPAFDEVIDGLRLGDNVVWQIDDLDDYRIFVDAYVRQSLQDGRNVIYMRFGTHPPLIAADTVKTYTLVPDQGFESFATQVYRIITQEGRYSFYVFDCLTDLLEQWCSDLMLGNFFRITCPYLYQLDTVAYFAILRDRHSFESIARVRETTQLLLDLRRISSGLYLHPLKVFERYSASMFLPHKFSDGRFETITSSVDAAGLFNPGLWRQQGGQIDYWDRMFIRATELLSLPVGNPQRREMFDRIISRLIGKDKIISELAHRFLTLEDIVKIKDRQIGTGFIGGKSVGMLLARNILSQDSSFDFSSSFEAHDSFYLGSDIFYTYLVQNGWWSLRMEQIRPEGYFTKAKTLREKLLTGRFPTAIRDRFVEMLEYFGQSPIIVRSSSLLEDNFGNAFAGKYESVFCVNQGSPEERYEEFENAVRTVYASTMDENALNYRLKRNLSGRDEQMALLVQRVSGDYWGKTFFPSLAGVGNSSNLYVWDKQIDPHAGMLRLVFGLGTRAVDRVPGDYPRIISLDHPLLWPVSPDKRAQYSQHDVDLLDLETNTLTSVAFEKLCAEHPDRDVTLFADRDTDTWQRMRELGVKGVVPYILSFQKLLSTTPFPSYMRNVLTVLEQAYNYPVDIEYTVNFSPNGTFYVNLLQCRPLQTKGFGKTIDFPENIPLRDTLFAVEGDFMGGNIRLDLTVLIYVDPFVYSGLSDTQKHEIARTIGKINRKLGEEGQQAMLIAPGRIGTTTPSMGVPVNFAEIANLAVLCELEFATANLIPELSYGSHFFQDLVESDIFYVALFPKKDQNHFDPERIAAVSCSVHDFLGEEKPAQDFADRTIRIVSADRPEHFGLSLFSDIVTQKCICIVHDTKIL
jgi:pyruvate, water dikinase